MVVLNLKGEQVLELVHQLPKPARIEALRRLLADPEWEALLAYGESRLDREFARRGLDRSKMTPDEIDAAIEQFADGR